MKTIISSSSSFWMMAGLVAVGLLLSILSRMTMKKNQNQVMPQQESGRKLKVNMAVQDDVLPQYRIANSETFNTSYAGREYFDVYSHPIRTLYSEVHWRDHFNISLPQDIVERFAKNADGTNSKVMAVTGYEVDQVFSVGQPPVPVPLTWAYNHHYAAWIYNSKVVRLLEEDGMGMGMMGGLNHGAKKRLVPKLVILSNNEEEEEQQQQSSFPKAQWFSEGNGGEMRRSYHGYPKGYAQLVESPDSFHVTVMQIDTWNRNTTGTAFVPGAPLPSSSWHHSTEYNEEEEEDIDTARGYSGLIECPCSDKLTKEWHMSYTTTTTTTSNTEDNKCTGQVRNATECFAAARQVLVADTIHEQEYHDDPKNASSHQNKASPAGCSATLHANGTIDIVWYKNSFPGKNNNNNNNNMYEEKSKTQNDNVLTTNPKEGMVQVVGTALGVVNLTVNYLWSSPGTSTEDQDDESSSSSSINSSSGVVHLKLVGPANRWLGVGFGSTNMCLHMQSDECPTGGPYAIVVSPTSSSSSSSSSSSTAGSGDSNTDGGSVVVTERKLGYHGPGSILQSSVKVESNVVVDGVRMIHLVRDVQGITEDHYFFDPTSPTLPVILATGCAMEFAQHCGHGFGTVHFFPVETPVTICQAGIVGTLGGNNFDSLHRCAPSPFSDLRDQQNPTCQIQTYMGGLACCRDGQSLLDAKQENPWPDQYLEYRLKFRFYFEEYTTKQPTRRMEAAQEGALPSNSKSASSMTEDTASHQNLVRVYWQTEAFAGEYDIVQCEPGTPKSQCVQVITSKWKVRDFLHDCSLDDPSYCTGKGSTNDTETAGIKLIYAGPHCHASTCLSMELYNADTGKLLCSVEPIYGQTDQVYDERGFLTIPPCLWSDDPTDGLMKPELLTLNTTLLSIKRNNNTLPHTGEMASWQMRAIVVPQEQEYYQNDNPDSSTKATAIVSEEDRPIEEAASTAKRRFAEPATTMEELRLTSSRNSPLLRHDVSSVIGTGVAHDNEGT